MLNQQYLLKQFTNKYREPFNSKLLERRDEDTIEAIIDIIKSCERSKFFTLKLDSYQVIEDPIQIHQKLYDYEQKIINNSKSKEKMENEWDFLHIKESDILLLVVNYIIGIDTIEKMEVLIMVPRYINKYYYKIYGNYYIPLYQIVDGSTYNNTISTNRKSDVVTFKSNKSPIKVFKYKYLLPTVDGEEVESILFVTNVFNRATSVFKFLYAKFGIVKTLYGKLNFGGIVNISDKEPHNPNNRYYIFNKEDVYIYVPKEIYDNDYVVQSAVVTIYNAINKDYVDNKCNIFDHSFWICSGGSELNNFSVERGEKLLESIESIYDELTMKTLKLDYETKKDIYSILLWIIGNFSELMIKDNLDIRLKRLRISEYVASLYGAKLTAAIHRVSDMGGRAKTNTIRRYINIKPNFLLNQLNKSSLVKYIDIVDDSDSTQALGFSFKGNQGIGEKKVNAVSVAQKRLHPSSMFIIDSSTSNKSDPGMSGLLCPYTDLYNNGFFTDYKEPDNWSDVFTELINSYNSKADRIESILIKDESGENITEEDINIIEEFDTELKSSQHIIERVMNIHNEDYINTIIFNKEMRRLL